MHYYVIGILLLIPYLQENQAQVVKIQKTFAGKESIVAPGRVSDITLMQSSDDIIMI